VEFVEYALIALYALALTFILVFSLVQLHLTVLYQRKQGGKAGNHQAGGVANAGALANVEVNAGEATPEKAPALMGHWPLVAVQLPVYNERYVVERLLEAVAAFNYPKDKLEIQVLDDSTDDTVQIIDAAVARWQAQGVPVRAIRRPNRKGFKAGALQYGMEQSQAEFIAIFDADFLPGPDFLQKTIPPLVANQQLGVVQTRWAHLNRNYSTLTQMQAFGLDAHFTVEQSGRQQAGSFINFNGTAGVWRKATIEDAGGWSADTLTEDLDLSYRAQLKGWRFHYLENVTSPAELPIIMSAIKSQQFRWNKGAAETARKNLGKVLRAPLGFTRKVHAFFHLLASSVYMALLLAAILSIPMLFIKHNHPELRAVFNMGIVFFIGTISIAWFYWVTTKSRQPENPGPYFWKNYPLFIAVSMGLALHNGMAVLEGWLGIKSAFIRTPKFAVTPGKKGAWKSNVYARYKLTPLTVFEGLLCLYFVGGLVVGVVLNDYGLFIFHAMMALGLGLVFYHSVVPAAAANGKNKAGSSPQPPVNNSAAAA